MCIYILHKGDDDDDDVDDDDDNNNINNNNRQYSSQNIIEARWAGHLASMGEARSAFRILVGKLEGKTPLGTARCKWEDNIKMDIQEVGRVAWTGLIWFRIGTGDKHL